MQATATVMNLDNNLGSEAKLPASVAMAAINYVLRNFAEEIELDDLAGAAGMSRFNFCRRFQKECGVSPIRWLWNFRAILAAEFIRLDPEWSLTDIAFTCGFTSSAHFSRAFKQMFKASPSAYRREARVADSSDGKVRRGFDAVFTENAHLVAAAARAAIPAVG